MSKEGGIDWAFAELAAIGSISMDGRLVRLAGQDSRRGTFVQRHSVLIDHNTGQEFQPLQHLSEQQGQLLIYDSALTEYAALGFEYGYSVANPAALVMWEAQFGDFVNAHSRSSMNTYPPVRPSGARSRQLYCYSRTVTKARDLTTPPAALNGSCSCVQRDR
jgi:2-oxoglutarate dehydrogenase complex dehydrogenase (E1) component-like enzyme